MTFGLLASLAYCPSMAKEFVHLVLVRSGISPKGHLTGF